MIYINKIVIGIDKLPHSSIAVIWFDFFTMFQDVLFIIFINYDDVLAIFLQGKINNKTYSVAELGGEDRDWSPDVKI